MRDFAIRFGLGISAAAVAAALPQAAFAQDETAPEEAVVEAQGNAIIVTGLRRSEELQDTPAAITAFNEELIENAGIDKPGDFINLTANVNLVEVQNVGTSFVVIRGITQARNSEPSVAVVVDGVQQVNPSQFNQDLFDIQQIEVLKGPQGALYGRNAIGGAIIITTKQPSDVFEGKVTAGVDNGFGWYVRGGVSGPITDGIGFRVSGQYKDNEGYLNNPFLGEEADPYENLGLRGNLLLDLGGGFEVDLRGSLDKVRTQAFYYNIVTDVNDTSLPIRVNNPGQNDRDMYSAAAKLSYENDNFSITSITSYDTLEEIITGDGFDFLPVDEAFCAVTPFCGSFLDGENRDLNQSQFLDVKAFSQELRVQSPDNEDLFWMFGGYFIDTDRFISTGNMYDLGQGVFPVYRTPNPNPATNPQFTFLSDQQDNFAWAVFANLGYQFSDILRVDASIRYDHDRRRNTTTTPQPWLAFINFIAEGAGAPLSFEGDVRTVSFDDWQPKVTVTLTPTNDLTFYGGYSRGFRSGGFNQTGVGVVAAFNGIVGVEDIFEAETADTFELGFKSRLFDRMLTLNGAVFTTTSRNSYFFVFLAANSTQNLGNVPEVKLEGFELETQLTPHPDIQFDASIGVVWSKIKEFPNPAWVGNEAPVVSRYTMNLGAQFTPELSSGLDLLARVDYRRIGKTWWDVPNSTVRDPVDLVDARLGVDGDSWRVTAFTTNLFNEKYNTEFSPGGFVFKARPRVYGVEASYEF
jgi:iron complex outermembrane receptor protein